MKAQCSAATVFLDDPPDRSLLEAQPQPTEAQTVEALNGSLCRCCGYPRILGAVRKAAESNSVTSLRGRE